MEDNQQVTDTQSGTAEMNLQETLRIPREEEDQNEVFHDSLTEAQWQEQLDAPASGAETEQTEGGAEGGGRQHPPTRITKSRRILRTNIRQKVKKKLESAERY